MHIESIGSVRGFRARFAGQLVQFGNSEHITHTHTHTHTHTLTTVHSVSHKARSRRLEGKLHDQPPTAEKRMPSSLYTQNTSHLPNSVSRVNWGLQSAIRDSIGSVRGFRARFAQFMTPLKQNQTADHQFVDFFKALYKAAFTYIMKCICHTYATHMV